MTEPMKNTRSKSRKPKVKEIAKEIDSSIVISDPKPKEKPTEEKIEELIPVAIAPVNRLKPDIKVKAISSVRGIIGNYRYSIEKGKVYTFPAYVADFLIQQDRVV